MPKRSLNLNRELNSTLSLNNGEENYYKVGLILEGRLFLFFFAEDHSLPLNIVTIREHMKFKTKHILILSFLLLAADQIVKIIVKTNMTIDQRIPVFGNWFYIRFIENPGAAYGFELGGDYGKLTLSLFRIVAIILIAFYIHRLVKRGNTPTGVLVGLTLILVGAMGNIVDSMFYGMIFSESTPYQVASFVPWGEGYGTFLHGNVVDMLYFPIIRIDTMPVWVPFWGGAPFVFFSPIFNLADTYISVAVIYMILFQRKFFK